MLCHALIECGPVFRDLSQPILPVQLSLILGGGHTSLVSDPLLLLLELLDEELEEGDRLVAVLALDTSSSIFE